MVVLMAVMIVWSIALKAPLEEPANPSARPTRPRRRGTSSGLQEMLVYFDPWLAGVVLPTLIIVGLMAIPYIDTNPKGNGYFTFRERKLGDHVFLFGFIVLWCALIVLGTFLRGPNWNFFGPYEFWDVNKLVPLNNIDLSEIIWIKLLKHRPAELLARPRDASGSCSSCSTSRCCRSLLRRRCFAASTRRWARRAITSASPSSSS